MSLSTLPLLSILIFLPLIGAFFILFIDTEVAYKNTRQVGLWTSGISFLISLFLYSQFNPTVTDYQFSDRLEIVARLNLEYFVGLDGISLAFILLTTFLFPLCILIGWETVKKDLKFYIGLLLILESFLLGIFCSLNLLLFYVFFEGLLIPLYFLIGLWGGENRLQAASKFFFYTLGGSIFMLTTLLKIFSITGTFDLIEISKTTFPPSLEIWLFLGFLGSMAIKIPMIPFHTWLPETHVQAPTSISVILAGILLKVGGFGILRFLIPLFPYATHKMAPWIMGLSILAIIYGGLITFAQKDLKRLITYSSISYMGFVTLGLFTLTLEGITGAIIEMISHALIAAGLFFSAGILYDRLHTRHMEDYGGLANVMPHFSVIFFILILATLGMPGTSQFIAQLFILMGVFKINPLLSLSASLGIVLAAVYGLWMYKRIVFGIVTKTVVRGLTDLDVREKYIYGILLCIICYIGIYPNPLLKLIQPKVQNLISSQSSSYP